MFLHNAKSVYKKAQSISNDGAFFFYSNFILKAAEPDLTGGLIMDASSKKDNGSLRFIQQGIREGVMEAIKLGIKIDEAYLRSLLHTLDTHNIELSDEQLAEALGISINHLNEIKQ